MKLKAASKTSKKESFAIGVPMPARHCALRIATGATLDEPVSWIASHRIWFRTCLLAWAIGLSQQTLGQTDTPALPKSKVAVEQLKSWIRDLGDEDYSKRQYATIQISNNHQAAMPHVREALEQAEGEQAERLLQFLSSIAADPYSPEGKQAYETILKITDARMTSKAVRAQRIIEVISEEQRQAAIDKLSGFGLQVRDRQLQVMSSSMQIKNAFVLDRSYTGDEEELECVRWITGVDFARLEGSMVSREMLKQVLTLPNLQRLQLVETQLRREDLDVLADAPELELLEIVYSPIGDECAQLLSDLPVIGEMYLFGTQLTHVGQQVVRSHFEGEELTISRGGFLGVVCPPTSVKIDRVTPRGAADNAELTTGDRILSVNGVRVAVFEDLRRELANFADGEEVIIEFERNFQVIERKVVLGRRDSQNIR